MQERTLTALLEMGERVVEAQATATRPDEEIARELEALAQAAGEEADRPQTALEDSMYQSGLQFAYDDSAQRVRALASQQPCDLAGRIRALVQEYAGRWADAEDEQRAALFDALVSLRYARDEVLLGHGLAAVGKMRESTVEATRQAADDLERILREHEAQR